MDKTDFGMSLGLLAVCVILYFIPLMIAVFRSHPNAVAISLLNLLLGWTLLGWIGALIWSVLAKKPSS